MSKREVVILSGVRTAIADFGGTLKDQPASELAGKVVAEAVNRSGLSPEDIGHCVIGSVLHGDRRDMYISRVAALKAGLPIETPSLTVNRLCGSGLQALVSAAQMILLDDCDAAVAGGSESMSRAPYWLPAARFGANMGDGSMVDSLTGVLTCPMGDIHMGVTAENVADQFSISREQQDELAKQSHQRAQRAIEENRFDGQILPIEIKTRKGVTVFEQDEHIRFDCDIESMAKLRPAFKKDGSVTAGNASGINDGAAALVLMKLSDAERRGHAPLGIIHSHATHSQEPNLFTTAPIGSIEKVLAKSGWSVGDVDLFEINEAFAVVTMAAMRDLDIPHDKVNVHGGACALGHPVGASGARIIVTLLNALRKYDLTKGVASLCIGGGEATAITIERLN